MVPTEILAEQHYYNLSEMLKHLHKTNKGTAEEDGGKINVVLLKSDLPRAEREEALEAITNGSADLIVGTQALIQEGVDFHKLGLVIIDEQHRFGVMQRATLRNKAQSGNGDPKQHGRSASSPRCARHDSDTNPKDARLDTLRRPERICYRRDAAR